MEADQLIRDIEGYLEYLREPTAFQAEQWLNGKKNNFSDLTVSDAEIKDLKEETDLLVERNVKSVILLENGIHLGKRVLEERVGGMPVTKLRQEVFLGPESAPQITGNDDIKSVQYLQNPGWKDVDFDARMKIRLKGREPLVIAFEGDRISRVDELVSAETDNGFGFKANPSQHIVRYNLTIDERKIVKDTLAGINSNLRGRNTISSSSR